MDVAWLVGATAALAFVAGAGLAARASRRLLVMDLADGEVSRASGRAPGEMLRDLADVARRDRANGRVVVVIEGGAAAVRTSGAITEGTAQRLRNVVGRFPLARIRTGPRVR